MARNIKLMLTENVDSLGIIGDVVNVRIGYARNFLLPRNMATKPSDEAIKAVAARRAEAEKQLAELRKDREALVKKLEKVEISLTRSCNDLGHLYGSVTQQEIAKALADAGYKGIKPRDVRLNQAIKRVDNYDVHIKFEADLDATIKLHVLPDRKLDADKREEVEVDDHGRLIEKKPESKKEGEPAKDGEKAPEGAGAKDGKEGGGERGERPRKSRDDDKPRRGRTGGGLAEAMAQAEASVGKKTGWGANKKTDGAAPEAAAAKPEAKGGKPEGKGKGDAKAEKSDKPAKEKKSKKD